MTTASNDQDFPPKGLNPESVWKHFAALCRIPRPSKHEERVRDYLVQWATGQGLESIIDRGGNLIIRKPASPGRENASGVILQAHLDMVCQKNDGVIHDFHNDPIHPVILDNLVLAENTTLGADDGIGVALALAALEDNTLVHGPLEALLTVDEEEGMGGANKLETGVLRGNILLNLDSETWGDFCLGCAGGMDISVSRPGHSEPIPSDWQTVCIRVSGLRGGHSGINIHEGRGNAIKILVRILNALQSSLSLRLASLTGGTARNALPREASAVIAIRPDDMDTLTERLGQLQAIIRHELAGVDEKVRIDCEPATAVNIMSIADQHLWLRTLHAAPHGIWRMSPSVPGAPETSNNLGTVNLQPDNGACTLMARSTIDSACNALADEITSLFMLSGIPVVKENAYPGWAPDTTSPLLTTCRNVYRQTFGQEPATHIIHAGLECGILKSKYPVLDTISFGPTIHSPHAPGESVEIDTVEKAWRFLKALLATID